ncbi:MAG: KH domain-containing protein [Clostridia bacterium]|nr:KH domain-containing protein [Clostridia bacterium]MBQ9544501.1 KH domain-containing protein [Clostridia bacterium]
MDETRTQQIDFSRILSDMVKAIVDNPDEVQVAEARDGSNVMLTLTVSPSDTGMIIGRHGNIANSLRTVMRAAAKITGDKVTVEIK